MCVCIANTQIDTLYVLNSIHKYKCKTQENTVERFSLGCSVSMAAQILGVCQCISAVVTIGICSHCSKFYTEMTSAVWVVCNGIGL